VIQKSIHLLIHINDYFFKLSKLGVGASSVKALYKYTKFEKGKVIKMKCYF